MDNVTPLNGYVALIDVLGFRELVGRDTDLTQVKKYVQTVSSLMAEKDHLENLQFVLFSDNLVVTTMGDTQDHLKGLVVACSRISFALLRQDVAVRGAIARGRFIRWSTESQGVSVAGRPIVEANEYEYRQNWVGIILAPSAVRGNEQYLQDGCVSRPPEPNTSEPDGWRQRNYLAMHLQPWGGVPFNQDQGHYDGYAVVPIEKDALTSTPKIGASLEETIKQLAKMKSTAPDPAAQAKYTATTTFLNNVRSRWSFSVPWG